jgi:hypothetical protein
MLKHLLVLVDPIELLSLFGSVDFVRLINLLKSILELACKVSNLHLIIIAMRFKFLHFLLKLLLIFVRLLEFLCQALDRFS